MELLNIQQIEKYYGNKSSLTKAIDDISFSVAQGEFLAIMGASGSGKTTLLNTADLGELQTLKGVGPVTAQRILDYRTQIGRFDNVDQLLEVKGIGSKTLAKFRDQVCVR